MNWECEICKKDIVYSYVETGVYGHSEAEKHHFHESCYGNEKIRLCKEKYEVAPQAEPEVKFSGDTATMPEVVSVEKAKDGVNTVTKYADGSYATTLIGTDYKEPEVNSEDYWVKCINCYMNYPRGTKHYCDQNLKKEPEVAPQEGKGIYKSGAQAKCSRCKKDRRIFVYTENEAICDDCVLDILHPILHPKPTEPEVEYPNGSKISFKKIPEKDQIKGTKGIQYFEPEESEVEALDIEEIDIIYKEGLSWFERTNHSSTPHKAFIQGKINELVRTVNRLAKEIKLRKENLSTNEKSENNVIMSGKKKV